jgi:hypothetical protein
VNDLTHTIDSDRDLIEAIKAIAMSVYCQAPESLGLAEIIASSQEVIDLSEALLGRMEERV